MARLGRGRPAQPQFFFGSIDTPDVTVALSGLAITSAQGPTVPALSIALSGLAATFAQGTITASGSGTAALTGQSATVSAGLLSPAIAIALSGQSIASQQGTLAPSASNALAGQAVTTADGTIASSRTLALSGLSASFAQGTVTATTGATVALTGQSLTAAPGTLSTATVVAASGQLLTIALGSVSLGDAPVARSSSGGFWVDIDSYRWHRTKKQHEFEQEASAARELQDVVDAEIAALMLKEEKAREFDSNIARLRAIAAKFADTQARQEMSERLQKALSSAVARDSLSAYLKLQTEIERAMEEEDVALMLLLNHE